MSKRTNKLYTVCVAKFAHMVVEAESSQDAVDRANDHLGDLNICSFVDSDIEVVSVDPQPSDIDFFCLEDDDVIYTEDGIFTSSDYNQALGQQESNDKRKKNEI